MSQILIETRGLKKYYKTAGGLLHAVDGVDLSIEKGKTLGVVGESGCGKSTLGRTLLRLESATGGEVLFDGKDVLKMKQAEFAKVRQKMQMIFQDPYSSLNPRMTVARLISEPLRVNGVGSHSEIRERVEELMDLVGLAPSYADSYPHELDGGRRQRIGVARALALRPEFIVCDEPVSALDVSIQAQILNLLMDLQDKLGVTYMFITHDLSVVKHISDEIMVMYLGQCVERAGSDELFRNPCHPYTKALLSAIPNPYYVAGKERKPVIKGEIVSPVDPEPGCRFAKRCPDCREGCTGCDLPLKEISPGHFVSCVLFPQEEGADHA